MSTCATCNKTILFGGVKDSGYHFCNKKCQTNGRVIIVANQIPEDLVCQCARDIYVGICPVCKKQHGPVDVHTAHKIASFVILSSWSSKRQISCRTCGRKSQFYGTVYSMLVGWWGIPWGIFMTPVQIYRNISAMLRLDKSSTPSNQLEQMVRIHLAENMMEKNQSNDKSGNP